MVLAMSAEIGHGDLGVDPFTGPVQEGVAATSLGLRVAYPQWLFQVHLNRPLVEQPLHIVIIHQTHPIQQVQTRLRASYHLRLLLLPL